MPKRPLINKKSLNKRRDKPAGITEKVINILKILNYIEQGKYPSARELAELCEVSERSVYRYLNILQNIVPIVFDEKHGGYRFENGSALRIIPIEKKELALLAALSEVISHSGENLRGTFNSILNKLYACAKRTEKQEEKIYHFTTNKTAPQTWQWFEMATDAIMNQGQLRIKYHAINTGQTTNRTIDPYGLVFHDGIWFIYAYCHLRKDYRWFALDRIEKISPMDKIFKKPEEFNMDEQLRKSWMIWEGKQTEVKVMFSPEIAEVIKRKPSWHPSEKRKVLPNGEVELTFTVSGTEEIKWWIYSWIPYVEVLEPKSLRDEMKRDLKRTLLTFPQI